MPRICRENDLGPIEYKRELKNMIESKIKKYATQMKFRLIEGGGTAYYLIGVKDDGEVIGIGSHDELIKSNLIFQKMIDS